jgi:threonine dehydrogenase-like Zn-dependent dehydrogenase
MGQVLVFTKPRTIGYEVEEAQPLSPHELRVQTLYSGISAGTELTAYRGSNPYLHKQWDEERRLFIPAEKTSLEYPVRGWGYEEVGQVIEIGTAVEGIPLGARVFGTWGHRTHHVLTAGYARDRLMPENLDSILGIFSHLGAIALNGIHDGRIRLGEIVAVFGLGALGQIVAQGARQSGARVIAIDLHDFRLDMARQLGAHVTLNAARENAAEAIKELTNGRGADVCFEVSGSTQALNEAVRAAAYSARVVAMGFFQGEAKGLFLGEEFHHNRVNIVGSQIAGTDPELTYRWNRLRLAQSAIQLQARGVLNLRPLITHIEPFERAAVLFKTLDHAPEQVVQAVIDFAGDQTLNH